MAYMSQEKKAKIAPIVKAILKRYGIKGSLAVRNHSTLVLNIKSGPIDFITNCIETLERRPGGFRNVSPAKNYIQINPYWYRDRFTGSALDFLSEVLPAMNVGNHDRSEAQYDYFDVGWYVNVNIGQWDKPYVVLDN
jgi:hypothetical protein